MTERLVSIWVIYQNLKDHPGKYVLRRQHATADGVLPDQQAWVGTDIDVLRAMIPPGCIRLPLMPGEDPVIYETWME